MKTLNDELTTMNNEARRERTLANIARRAATLFSDGYAASLTLAGASVNCYRVLTPEGRYYTVKVSRAAAAPGSFYGSKCSCPAFSGYGTCKHLQALELQEAEDAADAAQEAEWERAEELRNYGQFDRYDF